MSRALGQRCWGGDCPFSLLPGKRVLPARPEGQVKEGLAKPGDLWAPRCPQEKADPDASPAGAEGHNTHAWELRSPGRINGQKSPPLITECAGLLCAFISSMDAVSFLVHVVVFLFLFCFSFLNELIQKWLLLLLPELKFLFWFLFYKLFYDYLVPPSFNADTATYSIIEDFPRFPWRWQVTHVLLLKTWKNCTFWV